MADSLATELADWLAVMPPSVDADVEAARQRVGRLARQFERTVDAIAGELELTPGDLQALAALRRAPKPSLTPTELGAALGLTSGTVSVRVERLLRAGLVEHTSATDGRSRPVRLSRKGRARWSTATARRTEREAAAVRAALTEHQLDTLNQLLATVLDTLERRQGEVSPVDRAPG